MAQTNAQMVLNEIEIKPEFVTVVDVEVNSPNALDDFTQNNAQYTRVVEALPVATEPGVFLGVNHNTHYQEYYHGKGTISQTPVHMRVALPLSHVLRVEEFVGSQVNVASTSDERIVSSLGGTIVLIPVAAAQRYLTISSDIAAKVLLMVGLANGNIITHRYFSPDTLTLELQKIESVISYVSIQNLSSVSPVTFYVNTCSINDSSI